MDGLLHPHSVRIPGGRSRPHHEADSQTVETSRRRACEHQHPSAGQTATQTPIQEIANEFPAQGKRVTLVNVAHSLLSGAMLESGAIGADGFFLNLSKLLNQSQKMLVPVRLLRACTCTHVYVCT